MRYILIQSSVILFLNVSLSFAVNFSEYFNLKTGNVFVYYSTQSQSWSGGCTGTYLIKVVIADTANFSGKKYYNYTREVRYVSGSCAFSSWMFPFNVGTGNFIRLDSLIGTIYYYNPGNGCGYSPTETMIDSLNSKLNDVVTIRCVPSPYGYTCIDTLDKRKYQSTAGDKRREYVRSVGLVNNYRLLPGPGFWETSEQTLIGRVINGVVYGDTSFPLVGLNTISFEIPKEFSLFQNYPNPFNPVTKIKFSIPSVGNGPTVNTVRDRSVIKIYNALGHEVQVLINESLQPGTYEVDWDASNYPSGVYFYELSSGDFTQTKKMVLLK